MDDPICCPLSGSDDGDRAQFSTTRWVKARREHRCSECRETILAGASYERVTGKWDGDMVTVKTCALCAEIRAHFGCDGWIYGQLWEDLENNFFPDMKAGGPCMAGLSPAAKARLFERRMSWAE